MGLYNIGFRVLVLGFESLSGDDVAGCIGVIKGDTWSLDYGSCVDT